MKLIPLIWLAFCFVSPVSATPQIEVEASGGPLISGAVLDFGSMLGGVSEVVRVEGGMPGTAVIPGLPPGDYLVQRSSDGVANFFVLPAGPFQPNGNCEVRYDDPELEQNLALFYRAVGNPLVRQITLKNSGTTNLTINGISVDSEDPEALDFEVGFIQLPLVLAAGESETIELSFRAFDVGTRGVTLLITSDSAAQSSFTLELTGEGLASGACEPDLPLVLSDVSILPADGDAGARLSGVVSGNPGTLIQLEASGDFGQSIPWLVIAETTLDPEGQGAFNLASDPRTEAVAPPRQWFFRVRE